MRIRIHIPVSANYSDEDLDLTFFYPFRIRIEILYTKSANKIKIPKDFIFVFVFGKQVLLRHAVVQDKDCSYVTYRYVLFFAFSVVASFGDFLSHENWNFKAEPAVPGSYPATLEINPFWPVLRSRYFLVGAGAGVKVRLRLHLR